MHHAVSAVSLPFVGDQRRDLTAGRAQLAAEEALELVVFGCQDRQQLVTLLELGELGVRAGEFTGEPLVAVPQPSDPGFAGIGLMSGGPGGGSALLELVLEVARGPVEGRAGDTRLTSERLDVAGAASRDLPRQQPVDGRADAPLDLVALLVAQCHVIRPFRLPCRSLREPAWTARAQPEAGPLSAGGIRGLASRTTPLSAVVCQTER